MLSHVNVGVADFGRAFDFYSHVLPHLGLALRFSVPEEGWAGWHDPQSDRPMFVISKPFDGGPASAGNGSMVAFLAHTRDAVDVGYAAALAAGGMCEGPPGLRPHYHPDYYGAYFRDRDGNKICLCCHDPAPPP